MSRLEQGEKNIQNKNEKKKGNGRIGEVLLSENSREVVVVVIAAKKSWDRFV